MKYVRNFPRFLLDNGLIFEINRTILHQFGMVLSVDIDEDSESKAVLSLMSTDDEDGMIFDPETFEEGWLKYSKFLEKNKDKIKARKESLGFILQENIDGTE